MQMRGGMTLLLIQFKIVATFCVNFKPLTWFADVFQNGIPRFKLNPGHRSTYTLATLILLSSG